MDIQSGIYRLRNASSSAYLDASAKRQGIIHSWDSRPDSNNQRWIIEPRGDGYTLKNVASGQYASVAGTKPGTDVKGSAYPTEWKFKEDDGFYVVCLAGTKVAIDLDVSKDNNGTEITIREYTDSLQQRWKLEKDGDAGLGGSIMAYGGPVPPGTYLIRNVHSATALDLTGSGTQDGTKVIGFSVHSGQNQKWIFEPGLRGFKIRNAASGTFLSHRATENPVAGLLLTGNANPVEWDVRQSDKGYQLHVVPQPDLVLDLAAGDRSNGASICLWSNNNGDNQKWHLIQV